MDYTRIIIILCCFALGGFFSAMSGSMNVKSLKLLLKSKRKVIKKFYFCIGGFFNGYGLFNLFNYLDSTGHTVIGYCFLIVLLIYAFYYERKRNFIDEKIEESNYTFEKLRYFKERSYANNLLLV